MYTAHELTLSNDYALQSSFEIAPACPHKKQCERENKQENKSYARKSLFDSNMECVCKCVRKSPSFIFIFVHKVLKTRIPKYLADDFHYLGDIGRGGTRHGPHLLAVPTHRTVMFNKSFLVTACKWWNALPVELKRIEGHRRFGAAVLRWIRDGGGGWA
ncbi:hypothetical protein LSTR_LSTR010118 [Laodelphax striatellus]|uniref:Uncharacterized protein n=1 Tax=Laodelphax striatellus TaxID=195883 RepID=A0A482WJN1_LAOST|nr:hypothetical protein LSTR_LSTR010118 [Laodelphax striatellus]